MARLELRRDRSGISSFSLLGILVLLLATFTATHLAYVTHVDMSYRIKMEEMNKMSFKCSEVVRDLENHAVNLAYGAGSEADIERFAADYDEYVQRMASEGFDIWQSGDVTAAIDGVYSAYGGTIGDNYTVELRHAGDRLVVTGEFNITVRNARMNLELKKTVGFEKTVETMTWLPATS